MAKTVNFSTANGKTVTWEQDSKITDRGNWSCECGESNWGPRSAANSHASSCRVR